MSTDSITQKITKGNYDRVKSDESKSISKRLKIKIIAMIIAGLLLITTLKFFVIIIGVFFIIMALTFLPNNTDNIYLLDYADVWNLIMKTNTGDQILMETMKSAITTNEFSKRPNLQIESIDSDGVYFNFFWTDGVGDVSGILAKRLIKSGENPLIMFFSNEVSPTDIQEMRRISREFVRKSTPKDAIVQLRKSLGLKDNQEVYDFLKGSNKKSRMFNNED
jgi:hypothetical protein